MDHGTTGFVGAEAYRFSSEMHRTVLPGADIILKLSSFTACISVFVILPLWVPQ